MTDRFKASVFRLDLLTALGLFIVSSILGSWLMAEGVCGLYNDDAIYVSTAKALAEGQGYRLINLPSSPVQTKYPILYPAILAIIWKSLPSFPTNLLAMQYFTLLVASIGLSLCYLYLARKALISRRSAAFICLLCATSRHYVYFATQTMSEPLFLLLLILSLWSIDNYCSRNDPAKFVQFSLGILWALPFLCRIIGIVVPPVALLLLWKSKRPILYPAIGATFVIGLWVLFVLTNLEMHNSSTSAVYYTSYVDWWLLFGKEAIPKILLANMVYTSEALVYASLTKLGIDKVGLLHNFYIALVIVAEVTLLVGMYDQLRKWQPMAWMLLFYLAIVIVWPWMPFRFIVAVLPLLLGIILYGWLFLQNKFVTKKLHIGFVAVLVTTALIGNLWGFYQQAMAIHRNYFPNSILDKNNDVAWSSYQELFSWLRKNTKADDIMACRDDSMVYLYTQRKAIRPYVTNPVELFYVHEKPPYGELKDMEAIFKSYNPDYFIKTPFGSKENYLYKLLDEALIQRPGWMKLVYQGTDNRFKVYKITNSSKSSIEH